MSPDAGPVTTLEERWDPFFREYVDLIATKQDQELLMRTYRRCYDTLSVVYALEASQMQQFWNSDERFHEQGVEILYERFSYAMAMLAYQFVQVYEFEFSDPDADKKCAVLARSLSVCVDEAFRRGIQDMGLSGAFIVYYLEKLDDEFYDLWDEKEAICAEITTLRVGFPTSERTFFRGFTFEDAHFLREPEKHKYMITQNRDFLHLSRIYKRWGDVDAKAFLTTTKRKSLPLIIDLFLLDPRERSKPQTPKRWQFWKAK